MSDHCYDDGICETGSLVAKRETMTDENCQHEHSHPAEYEREDGSHGCRWCETVDERNMFERQYKRAVQDSLTNLQDRYRLERELSDANALVLTGFQENARLREAMKKYGDHSGNCMMGWVKADENGEYPCTCGFKEALAADGCRHLRKCGGTCIDCGAEVDMTTLDEREPTAREPAADRATFGQTREDEYMCRGGGVHRSRVEATACTQNPCLVTEYHQLAANPEKP